MAVNNAQIVIAAYNEAGAIRAVVADLVGRSWTVVVVDDCSGDNTADEAALPGVTVLRHSVNLGQGAALQTGIEFAVHHGADAIVTFDADGQRCADDIPNLLAPLTTHDVVLGSRFLGKHPLGATRRRRAFLRLATILSNRLSGLPLADAHCGLRAFRASVAPALPLTQNRMAHASEFLRSIRAHRLRVAEVGVTVRYTDYSRLKGQSATQAIRILFDYCFKGSRIR